MYIMSLLKKPHYQFKKNHNNNNNKNKDKHIKVFRVVSTDSSTDDEHDYDDENGAGNNGVTVDGNHIYFQTNVSDKSVTELIKVINQKNNEFKKLLKNKLIESVTPTNLWLHITSFGGSLLACFRAVDAIKKSIMPIYTVVEGYAASAGTLMSVVGKKRFMTPSAYMLIHQLSGGACGTYWELKDEHINTEMMMNDIYNIYVEHTKMTKKELEEYLSHDLWFKVDKCIEIGLVDEIF